LPYGRGWFHLIGKTLGHYQVIEKIGAGGMGEVYLAHDEHLLRNVAIKVLPAGVLADESARKRFRKEALAISKLSHPNIGTVHDFDTEDGVDFLVMEYIPGQTLSGKLQGCPLLENEIIALGVQMAEGLAAAHAHDIVHRDLKPGNLLITPDGRLKILDFGLAKMLKPAGEVAATETITETQGVAGTLPYMAPEQLLGKTVDARTDIHAAGAVIYEMASGRRPFHGETIPKLTDAILHHTPPAPRALNASLSPRLEEIVFKCLEKDPALRYQSALELSIDLRRLSAPVSAVSAPPVRRPSHRWVFVGAAMLAAMVALTWIAVILMRTRQAPTGRRLSTGALASKNSEANEYYERAMAFATSQSDLPRARQMLERAMALDPHFSAAQAEYGFTHLLMVDGGWSNDSSWLYKAEEDIRRVLQEAPDSSRAHSALAAVYCYMGRKEQSPAEAETALRINPDELDGYNWLVNYYLLNEDTARAEAVARQALERAPLFFPARMNLGEALRFKGDTSGAIREQEKVLESDPQNVYAITKIAKAYMDVGDLQKVRQTLERSRPADRQNYHIRIAWALLLLLEGKRAEAMKEMDEEVLKYGAVAFDVTESIAQFYAVLGETAKAIDWLDRAVRNGNEHADWLRRDRSLAGIREQPRFKQILDSIVLRRQQRQNK